MLKTILNLKGVSRLESADLKKINGGGSTGMCNYDTGCSEGCSETFETGKKCSTCCIADSLEMA